MPSCGLFWHLCVPQLRASSDSGRGDERRQHFDHPRPPVRGGGHGESLPGFFFFATKTPLSLVAPFQRWGPLRMPAQVSFAFTSGFFCSLIGLFIGLVFLYIRFLLLLDRRWWRWRKFCLFLKILPISQNTMCFGHGDFIQYSKKKKERPAGNYSSKVLWIVTLGSKYSGALKSFVHSDFV